MDQSLVKSLKDCWAREGQRLEDHLLEVASSAGSPGGSPTKRLDFLAGLLHDAGKARPSWQSYFERSLRDEPGLDKLPHAYFGAALFALYARTLLDNDETTPEIEQRYYLLVQDLQDHHGRLRDRTKPPTTVKIPWQDSMKGYPPNDAFFADLDSLLHRFFPALPLYIGDYKTFSAMLDQLEKTWERHVNRQTMRLSKVTGGAPQAYAHWICRDVTGNLISADRLSASALTDKSGALPPEKAKDALQTFKTTLNKEFQKAIKKGQRLMADKRRSVHEQTLASYLRHQDTSWFTLNLPVGWGKTFISLRIALESVIAGHTERIIYVAPYLAILSQAAKDIHEATGLEVLEHHHLALLNNTPNKDWKSEEKSEEKSEDLDVLTMESWRAPIVATTFNQLFRAIFPASAQQSIRIPALQRAFVIVDEPQIINVGVYNAFLKGLDVLRERQCAQVMLVTATLPPTKYGLSEAPYDLTPPVESANRYKIVTCTEPWKEQRLVDEALNRLENYKQVAVILNTIADAINVYWRIKNKLGAVDKHFCLSLHGMMEAVREIV